MEILIYVAKVSLYWTLFYICYRLLLSHQTFFVWNRIYLISSLLVSFALPFIIYPESAPVISITYSVTNPNFTVSSTPAEQLPLITWTYVVWAVYLLGAMFMAFKLFKNIRQLNQFLTDGEHIELEDCKIILIDSNRIGSFSFLKWIVVNRNDYENHFDPILRHEMVHMQQWHSMDILLVELLKIIFWFNPLLILYKKSLQEVHEFLADHEAPNRENYATFLVSYALNAPIASLTNHFYKPSQIKTRIQMIYKNRSSKWLLGSYLFAFVTIGMVALFVAGCEQKENDQLSETMEKLTESKKPVNLEGKKIYTVVEQQPMFPGGIEEMYKFLGQKIRYPKAAVDAGATGRVFLSFVVTETGEIGEIQVLKGIGHGCDEEAVRVLSLFPKWEPAKQDGVPVNVRYNLPINFQMEESELTDKKRTALIDKQFDNKDGSKTILTKSGSVVQEPAKNSTEKVRITEAKVVYIVDGKIEKDADILKKIDPAQIESINILKDQKAIDAYGEKGSHGVISITTKKI
ncbi:M56 family metallopeptidase [Dyadobacter sp. CY356]|uniref:M56 family metallopeptidase n=1 Tax=Dyadobacter sp. CY356 TaxID=2906442 RepID=UPI001F26DBC1|nr:M56 family metallopeptidase [Dyadobacter sp. CY356]MCF0056724.1 TonB family protein [Dyadobacter sp. CY356]